MMINDEETRELWEDNLRPLAIRGSGVDVPYDIRFYVSKWIHSEGLDDWKNLASIMGLSMGTINYIDNMSGRFRTEPMLMVFEEMDREQIRLDIQILLQTLYDQSMISVLDQIWIEYQQDLSELVHGVPRTRRLADDESTELKEQQILLNNSFRDDSAFSILSSLKKTVDIPYLPDLEYSVPPDGLDLQKQQPDSGFSSTVYSLEGEGIPEVTARGVAITPTEGQPCLGQETQTKNKEKPKNEEKPKDEEKMKDEKKEEKPKGEKKPTYVFVTFTEDGREVAIDLIRRLKEEKIQSLTLQMLEMSGVLNLRPTAIDDYLNQVDYIIPVLSPGYMREVKDQGFPGSLTKYIFQRCVDNYRMDNCFNFDCKPVMSQTFAGKRQMYNELRSSCLVLRSPCLMPREFDKFANILRNTKKWIR